MIGEQTKQHIADNRNEIKTCPCCGSNIQDRKVTLYKGLVDALYKVYRWCGANKRHEFEMKEIKDLLGKNEYARFGDLVRFGGLVYKPKEEGKSRKALYGLNMARAKEFFSGVRPIPVQIVLNQITNEIVSKTDCYVGEFPTLLSLLNKGGLFDEQMEVVPVPREIFPKKKKYVYDKERNVMVEVLVDDIGEDVK